MASSNYASWSVVAGEQPTTAKWNILGTNDSSFNSGLGFNDSIIIARHISNNAFPVTTVNGVRYMYVGQMLIQWATSTVASGGTTINFAVAFSSTPSATATILDVNNQTAWVSGISTSAITLKQIYTTAPLTVGWIAIGLR